MKRVIALALLVLFGLITSADADPARRIEELLFWQYTTVKGQSVTRSARLNQCILHMTWEGLDACNIGTNRRRSEKVTDLQILETNPESILFYDKLGSKPAGQIETVFYRYEPRHFQRLSQANSVRVRILNEETANHPSDLVARNSALAKRYREEIEQSLFAQSYETTTLCSGLTINKPQSGSSFLIFIKPESAKELVDLIASYVSTCAPPLSG